MLQNIREKLTGRIASVVIAFMLVPFAFFGVNYSFTSQGYAVKVNGEEIGLQVVQQEYQNQLARYAQAGEMTPEFLRQIEKIATEQVIERALVRQYLTENGFAVSDDQVMRSLRDVPQFQVEGQFDPETYRRVLAENALDPVRFESDQRQNILFSQLSAGVVGSAFMTPAEFRRVIELGDEKRRIEYASVDPAAFLAQIEVTDADVATWYEANADRYRTSETVDLRYLEVNDTVAAERVAPTDAALKEYFERNAEQYRSEAQRRASHILLRTDEDEAAARELAASLLARVQAGEPFDELAKQYSKDGGSARVGGDLGWVSRGDFVGPVEDAVFSLEKGKTSGIVESNFGLHIIRLTDIRAAALANFADVKADVKQAYIAERRSDLLLSLKEGLADQLFEAETLAQIAQAMKLQVNTVNNYTAGDALPFGSGAIVDERVFGDGAISVGQISDLLELSPDRVVVVELVTRREAGMRPLAEVSDAIRSELSLRRAGEIAAERSEQLAARARADGSLGFAELVADTSATAFEEKLIGRREADVPAALSGAVFAARLNNNAPHVGTVAAPGAGYFVFRLSEIVPGDAAQIPAQALEATRAQLASRTGSAQLQALVGELRDRATIKYGSTTQVAGADF